MQIFKLGYQHRFWAASLSLIYLVSCQAPTHAPTIKPTDQASSEKWNKITNRNSKSASNPFNTQALNTTNQFFTQVDGKAEDVLDFQGSLHLTSGHPTLSSTEFNNKNNVLEYKLYIKPGNILPFAMSLSIGDQSFNGVITTGTKVQFAANYWWDHSSFETTFDPSSTKHTLKLSDYVVPAPPEEVYWNCLGRMPVDANQSLWGDGTIGSASHDGEKDYGFGSFIKDGTLIIERVSRMANGKERFFYKISIENIQSGPNAFKTVTSRGPQNNESNGCVSGFALDGSISFEIPIPSLNLYVNPIESSDPTRAPYIRVTSMEPNRPWTFKVTPRTESETISENVNPQCMSGAAYEFSGVGDKWINNYDSETDAEMLSWPTKNLGNGKYDIEVAYNEDDDVNEDGQPDSRQKLTYHLNVPAQVKLSENSPTTFYPRAGQKSKLRCQCSWLPQMDFENQGIPGRFYCRYSWASMYLATRRSARQ